LVFGGNQCDVPHRRTRLGPSFSDNQPLFPDIFVSRQNGFVEAANCFVALKVMPSLLFVGARWEPVHGQRRFKR
jgi:hypothetical protein